MATRRTNGTWQVTKLPNGDWHPEEIKAAVRMSQRGMSLTKLSRTNGLHPNACGHAIAKPHYLGELAIARLLGVSPAEIWPDRHDAAGARICQVRASTKLNGATEFGHPESSGPARERVADAVGPALERRAAA